MTYQGTADQIIDSRDLIEYAEDEDNRENDPDTCAEIDALAEDISDWQYGAGLIREDYFTEYAQGLAEDIGAIDPKASWPLSCIDWEAAAAALKQDYTEVEYLGMTYYVRA